jgi:hypothetical protein
VTSLSSERNQRIRRTRTARREEGAATGGKAEDEHGGADGRGIGRVESEKKAREQPGHRERRSDATGCAERHGRAHSIIRPPIIRARVAPRARRVPISFVRRATANDIVP